jgi:hypothetical protein
VRLAFGDDDIPYIVETSGLELVDEDIDSVINMMRPDDEPAELEELDELDEAEGEAVEEVEELEEAGPAPRGMSENDIAELASQIEFSPMAETDTTTEMEPPLHDDLEIVSPFATMLSNISVGEDSEDAETEEQKSEFDLQPESEPADIDFADHAESGDPEDEKKKTVD